MTERIIIKGDATIFSHRKIEIDISENGIYIDIDATQEVKNAILKAAQKGVFITKRG